MSEDTTKVKAAWPGYALPQGTVVNGYRIERVLGSGGFGITYLAHDLLQQRFAIKEYYPRQFAIRQDLTVFAASTEDAALFDECRERFLREAQALVVLSRVAGPSDGIVRVQTYFEAHGTCFLVMDYIEGASLASVLRQEPGGLAAARVRSLMVQLLSSIRVVHKAGLMHRDIKPANIILRDDDRLVLIDFGSSRPAARSDMTSYTQIYSGGYAPPEQMLGARQGEFSDIYAIGAVCYRAIGGNVVDAVTRQNALAARRPDPQPPAERIGAGRYPRALLAAIDAALATDPAKRLQTVDAMLAMLGSDKAADEPTIVAPRRTVPIAPPQRRRGGVWALAAGGGALTLCVVAYLVLRSPAVPPPASHPEVAASTPANNAPPQVAPPQEAVPATQQSTAASAHPEAAPTIAPAPPPPAEQPQREAVVMPPPAPETRPAPPPPAEQPHREAVVIPPPAPEARPAPPPPAEQPQGEAVVMPPPAPVARPAPPPPAEQPQREAIVMPPQTPEARPVPPPAPPSPLELGRAAALSLPCSALNIASGQNSIRVSGLATAGPELDRLLAGLRGAGRVADDITRVDRFACAPIATVNTFVRQTWDSTPPTLAVRLEPRSVASGARLGIDVTTKLATVYIDLYQGDGSVRHLLRPLPSGVAGKQRAEWVATPPAGPRLVVAIGAAAPLDLGPRPETERTADYLAALQPSLQRAAEPPAADLAIVTVRGAEPAVAKVPQSRPVTLRSGKCANIVSRAQLGETLSDAELAALRTECRS